VRQLLKGNAADNTAIEELLVQYLGDLPMIDAPGQLVNPEPITLNLTPRILNPEP
jgi:hypothetical protein